MLARVNVPTRTVATFERCVDEDEEDDDDRRAVEGDAGRRMMTRMARSSRVDRGRRNRARVRGDDVFSVVETRSTSAFGFGGDQRGTRAGTRGEGGSRARARDAREREKERRDV